MLYRKEDFYFLAKQTNADPGLMSLLNLFEMAESENINNVADKKATTFIDNLIKMEKNKGEKYRGACYKCKCRTNVPGSAHSACTSPNAMVKATDHGVKSGWFYWPYNFDPVWLEYCSEAPITNAEAPTEKEEPKSS